MKHLLLATIAAVLMVGRGEPSDFHKAAGAGNIEAVKQHLAAGADVNAIDRRGWTPLHQADVRKKRSGGWTPLHYAAYGGHKEIAELLIGKGADVNTKDAAGMTPLDFAIIYNYLETADHLRKHGGKTGEELKAEGK